MKMQLYTLFFRLIHNPLLCNNGYGICHDDQIVIKGIETCFALYQNRIALFQLQQALALLIKGYCLYNN